MIKCTMKMITNSGVLIKEEERRRVLHTLYGLDIARMGENPIVRLLRSIPRASGQYLFSFFFPIALHHKKALPSRRES